jgi:hypothetical protein
MKKIHTYILENTDFLHGVFVSIQWMSLLIIFYIKTDNNLEKEWLNSAFILSGIGYLSIILFPFFIFQKKSEKVLHGIIIIVFYSEIFFIFQLIFTAIFSRDDILYCFANTGLIFTFSCFKKLLAVTSHYQKSR